MLYLCNSKLQTACCFCKIWIEIRVLNERNDSRTAKRYTKYYIISFKIFSFFELYLFYFYLLSSLKCIILLHLWKTTRMIWLFYVLVFYIYEYVSDSTLYVETNMYYTNLFKKMQSIATINCCLMCSAIFNHPALETQIN